MNGIKLDKCAHKWHGIENKKTENFCEHCKICVPDLSNKSNSEVAKVLDQYTCARFHERHLEGYNKQYFFINRFERKLEGYGFVKITATLVFTYLMLVGCASRRRMAGAYSAYSTDYKDGKTIEQAEVRLPRSLD